MLGWTVLSQLKQDPATRHIPVQMVTLDEDRQHGLARGAFSFITKPTTTEGLRDAMTRIKDYAGPRRRRLLVVEDDPAERMSIEQLLGHDDIDIVTVDSGGAALDVLHEDRYDCVVLDLRLPDMSGFEVLERLREDDAAARHPGGGLHRARALSRRGRAAPHPGSQRGGQGRRVARAPARRDRALPPSRLLGAAGEKQRMLERLHRSDEDLMGKTVLVVDDDVRNIFALSSVLERRGMKVLTATTGADAIDTMETTTDLAIVLMDIMMPGMDGYQTMQAIRRDPRFQRLPIIALTAKAMKGDREKCLEAGASDYLAKPVNTEQLLSALRMWLHR